MTLLVRYQGDFFDLGIGAARIFTKAYHFFLFFDE